MTSEQESDTGHPPSSGDDETPAQPSKPREKLGILVVHGIGSPEPGTTLTRLADALEVEGYITHRGDLVDDRRRSAPDAEQATSPLGKRLIRGGPLPVECAYGFPRDYRPDAGQAQLPPVVLAEAFWADVTRLPGGASGVLRGYFDMFFNVITLINTAVPLAPSRDGLGDHETNAVPKLRAQQAHAEDEPWMTRMLAWIARGVCILICGPIACANVFLLFNFAAMWLLAPFFYAGEQLFGAAPVPLTAGSQVAAGAVSLFLLAVVATLTGTHVRDLGNPGRIGVNPTLLAYFSLFAWLLVGASLFEYVFEMVMPGTPGDTGPTHLLPTGTSYYLVYVAGGLIVPLLLSVLVIAFLVYLAWTLVPGRRRSPANLEIILIAPLLQAALWMLVVPEIWRLIGTTYPKSLFAGMHQHLPCLLAGPLKGVSPGSHFEWEGLQALSVVTFLMAVVLFTVARSRAWPPEGWYRRVIVSKGLALALAGLLLFASVHVMANALSDLQPIVHPRFTEMVPLLASLMATAPALAAALHEFLWPFETLKASPVVLLFVSSFALESIRQGFSLADEVISYLEYNGAEARRREQRYLWDRVKNSGGDLRHEEAPDTLERRYAKALDTLEYRRPIRHCFTHALDTLLSDYEITRLLIVSHSQGTVIALDELIESRPTVPGVFRNGAGTPVSVDWVTMGSPIHHLYQHYFPACYPSFPGDAGPDSGTGATPVHPYWNNLVQRVDRWVNICRSDDFVGTTMGLGTRRTLVESTDGTAGGARLEFSEHTIAEGGHGDYWTDKEVLEKIGLLFDDDVYGRYKSVPIKLKKVLRPKDAD